MRALVTGAGGFLGRHVVAALRARGVEVRALDRTGLPGGAPGVETFRADLCTSPDLAAAFAGVDVAVHLAAALSGPPERQLADTVLGTTRFLDAMAEGPCRRLVHASSFAVYDWSAIAGALREASPLEPEAELAARDAYSIAKARQERIVREAAARHGWALTVLRPGFLWGRDRAYVAAVGPRVGPLHLCIAPTSRPPLTHVENCADLFAVAATDPRAAGETLNVIDGGGETSWEFLGAYLRGTGTRALRVPVPYRAAFALVKAAHALLRRRASLPNLLVPCRFESRLKPVRSESRAGEVLGWRPPLGPDARRARTYGPA
jgi:UDP-glucose 4-epimerase